MALQKKQQQLLFQKVARVTITLEKINQAIVYIQQIAKSYFVRAFFKGRADRVLEITQEIAGVADILTEAGGIEKAREVLNKCVELGGFEEALQKLNAIEITYENVEETPKKKTTTKKS